MSYETPCTGGSTALCNDNCPDDFNPDQADSDGDGIGDMCDDTDDGYPNTVIATIAVGSGPYGGIAVSPEGDFVYVSNYGSDSVSVIDTSSHDVVDTITVGDGPIALSMTSDGAFVYVNNYLARTVSVIRTEDNTVIGDPIGVGTYPYAISMAPHGDHDYAYVTNYGSGSVSVIDTSTHSFIENITVGPSPWGVSLTRDGAFAYVAHYGGSVSVIDTSTHDVVDTITVGGAISGISVTPDGTHAYVTNYGSGSVSVIDTSTHEVVVTVSVGNGPDGIAMTPNGAYVYVNNYLDDTVSIIQTSGNTVIDADPSTVEIDPTEVGDEPRRGIAVSSDGKRVYVGNYVSNSVSVIGISDVTIP
jgi:YVTN family beta-propeller protein